MKPAPFDLVRPRSLAEALEVLDGNPNAKVLAGGQSLIPLLSMRLAAPELLVDINAITELDFITAGTDGVRIGALARHTDVAQHPEARRVQPLLATALELVAHPTIRNRGTTLGSVVHADASAEMPVVLALLGGTVTVASTAGTRTIPVADLYVGPLETTVRPNEIAVEGFFPALPADAGVAMKEVARRHGDYALCGVAAVVRTAAGPDGATLTSARAGFLSVCEVPTAVDLSAAFRDGTVDDAGLDRAVELALAAVEPEGDIHASAAYRTQLVRVLTRQVLLAAFADSIQRRADRQ